jgi:DNA-binding PadR family transcriptional regulator
MAAAINLKPISYMVLGMLRLGAKSGYAIKKAADMSTGSFWPTSLAQVYPELARLEQHGLVTRHEDPHGERKRAAYELTESGEAALLAWLRSPRTTPTQLRSEPMLRLFFADALPEEDQLALVQRLRERAHREGSHLQEGDLKSAVGGFGEPGVRFPLIVRLWAEGLFSHSADWLGQLEAELEGNEGDD